MALTERLAFLLDLRADGAIREMRKVGDTATKELGRAEDRSAKLGASFTRAGAGMLAAGGLMAAGLASAGKAASDLDESLNVTGLTFGSAADDVEAFADTAANGLGLSKRAALDAAAGFGGLLQNLGMTRGESVQTSKQLTTLAADMASAFNADTSDAVMALGSALRGESEPIRRFNVFLDDAAVKARAVELGLADSTAEVSNAAKMQGRLSLIMEHTSRIQGDFANTADGAANAQRRMSAQVENFKAAMGEAAVPAMEQGLGLLNGLLGAFSAMPDGAQAAVSQVAVLSTGVLLLGGAAASVTGKAMTMFSAFKKLRSVAKDGESVLGTLRGSAGGAVKVGAAFGLATTAVAMYADMMGKASQAGKEFAAKVEESTMPQIKTYDDLQAKLAAVREGADELRSSQSGGPIGSIIDSDYNRSLQVGASELENFGEKLAAMEQRSKGLADATGITEDAAVEFLATQAALGVEFDTTAEAASEWERVVSGGTEAVNAQITSIDDLRSAIKKFLDEQWTATDAVADYEEKIDSAIEKLKENASSYDLSTEAGRDNTQSVKDLQLALGDLYWSQLEQGKSAGEARLAVLNHANSLRQQAIDAGVSTGAIDGLIGRLDLASTFDRIETEFSTPGLNQAVQETSNLAWQLNNLPLHKRIMVELVANVAASQVGSAVQSAAESMSSGRRTLTPDMAAASSGGTAVNVTVNAGMGTDGAAVGEQIAASLRSYVKAGGEVTVSR